MGQKFSVLVLLKNGLIKCIYMLLPPRNKDYMHTGLIDVSYNYFQFLASEKLSFFGVNRFHTS